MLGLVKLFNKKSQVIEVISQPSLWNDEVVEDRIIICVRDNGRYAEFEFKDKAQIRNLLSGLDALSKGYKDGRRKPTKREEDRVPF